MTQTSVPEQTQRRDARQNRARILAAAADICAVHGLHASPEQIIQAAGVGRSTFFRHFPDRESLLAALLERNMDCNEAHAKELENEEQGLLIFLHTYSQELSHNAPLIDYWLALDPDHPALVSAYGRASNVFGKLLDKAIAAGWCRSDLTVNDLITVCQMLAGAFRGVPLEQQSKLGLRSVQLLVEGLLSNHPTSPRI